MSSAIETPTLLTPDDLLTHPEGDRFELVDGVLVEPGMGTLSTLVAMKLGARLEMFCDQEQRAWVFGADCLLRCFPGHANTIRKPDVCCVLQDRLPLDHLTAPFLTIAPDLVVEVVSPNDKAYEVDRKVKEYLDAEVRLIWVINPEGRSAWVYRLDGSATFLRDGDELDGEDVLPQFRCRLNVIFPPRVADGGGGP